ncbi:Lrp/AsnC family transcriptional regulator [Halobacterium litoreum]|uniref:Lrp/AsnC family transcriptional regulator n=1 Tax=Halobacterium litoreum TaxID=2039234 RepID=A0ABD5NB56_9EURY|nr:Lrp/AsnC ligand binding domain-containing protein [Halobacterium litoreum]UHH14589.1 Lrp/AsnC ligand binding domain-containing protein [Halobacterium litoreum]
MDERDVTLLKAISDLGTGSPEKLHEETDIPVSTIHYRLNNLRDAGVVENDLYDLDLDELGLGVTVVLEVLTDYEGSYEDVAAKISDVEGVTQTFFTMGETDFMVVARLPDSDDVERLISDFEALPEVDRTNSTFVISREKDTARPLQSYSLDTLLAELADDE